MTLHSHILPFCIGTAFGILCTLSAWRRSGNRGLRLLRLSEQSAALSKEISCRVADAERALQEARYFVSSCAPVSTPKRELAVADAVIEQVISVMLQPCAACGAALGTHPLYAAEVVAKMQPGGKPCSVTDCKGFTPEDAATLVTKRGSNRCDGCRFFGSRGAQFDGVCQEHARSLNSPMAGVLVAPDFWCEKWWPKS